jgi:hypothetical protein
MISTALVEQLEAAKFPQGLKSSREAHRFGRSWRWGRSRGADRAGEEGAHVGVREGMQILLSESSDDEHGEQPQQQPPSARQAKLTPLRPGFAQARCGNSAAQPTGCCALPPMVCAGAGVLCE